MSQGNLDRERFWISFTVRLAFGMMFIFAALNIFSHVLSYKDEKPDNRWEEVQEGFSSFADGLSKPFANTWMNVKWKWWPIEIDKNTQVRPAVDVGMGLIRTFLYGMPFIFAVLGFCILTGIFLYPALRFASIYLVLLGLGKYVVGESETTAQDFIYAAFICIGLYMSSGRRDAANRDSIDAIESALDAD